MAATHRQWDDSRDQLKYWGGALLIHVLIGVLLVGFNWGSSQSVIPQLAINAVVVDRNTLNQLVRQQAAPKPPAEPDTRQQEEREKQRQEQERLKQEQAKQEQLKREQLELQRVQDQQRIAAEKQKQLEEQHKAQQAEQQRQEAEKKRVAEIQQKQRDAELKRQADIEARAQAAREAELAAQMAAEEGRANAVNAGLLNQYVALIQQKVMRNWIRPATARPGLECEVKVTQASGGTVLSVAVGKCNGDAAVRASIEAAVQLASPLPAPPDPRLFERNLILNFKPTE